MSSPIGRVRWLSNCRRSSHTRSKDYDSLTDPTKLGYVVGPAEGTDSGGLGIPSEGCAPSRGDAVTRGDGDGDVGGEELPDGIVYAFSCFQCHAKKDDSATSYGGIIIENPFNRPDDRVLLHEAIIGGDNLNRDKPSIGGNTPALISAPHRKETSVRTQDRQ